jgi:hypothetical protein
VKLRPRESQNPDLRGGYNTAVRIAWGVPTLPPLMVQHFRELGIGPRAPAGCSWPTQQLKYALNGLLHPARVVDHVVKHKCEVELVDPRRDLAMAHDVQARQAVGGQSPWAVQEGSEEVRPSSVAENTHARCGLRERSTWTGRRRVSVGG